MKKKYLREHYKAVVCHGSMEFKEVLKALHSMKYKWNNGKVLMEVIDDELVLGEINPLKIFNNSLVLKINDKTIQYTTTNWCRIRKIKYVRR